MDNQCLCSEAPAKEGVTPGPRGFGEYLLVRGYECYKRLIGTAFVEAAVSNLLLTAP